MAYQKAKIENDEIVIPAGQRTFIDVSTPDLVAGSRDLLSYFTREEILQEIENKRGHIMVMFDAVPDEVRIPTPFAALHTGYFYLVPEGESLNQIAINLYGAGHAEPVGFFEWLSTAHPDAFKRAFDAAEAVEEVVEEVEHKVKTIGSDVIKVVAGVALLTLLFLMLKGRK